MISPADKPIMFSDKVAILGPGLLGGSIAMALRDRGFTSELALWARRPEAAAQIRTMQLPVDVSTNLRRCVADAGLVILCTPVDTIVSLFKKICPMLRPGCVVTDVGSVKSALVHEMDEIAADRVRMVGGHPIAGSERAGIEHARADLFLNAACILTRTSATDEAALGLLTWFWELLGCRVSVLSPEEHDEIMARVSHLPHLVASALARLVRTREDAAAAWCGNGFLDTTRVASGSADLWTGIMQANRHEIVRCLSELLEDVKSAKEILEQGNPDGITSFLHEAKLARDSVQALRNHVTDQS